MTVAIRKRTVQARALPEIGEGQVEAYASIFGVPYNIGFGMKEQIEPGAFDDSHAAKPQLPIFWMHSWDEGLLIGDGAGSSDERGVKVEGQLYVDDDLAKRIWRAMNARAITEWSIAYIAEAWEVDPDDEDLEHVTKGELIEASVVVRGANPDTETIDVRRRSLVVPLLENGELRWIPAEEIGNSERLLRRRDAPAAQIPDGALEALERPEFRELVREQLSSTPVPSDK